MTDYATKYSDDPATQKLLAELIEAGKEVPDDLRRRILDAGEEMTRALSALVDDEELIMEDSPGEGWVGIRAVELLGEREDPAAIDVLIEELSRTEPRAIGHQFVINAVLAFGEDVVEPVLAAAERTTNPEAHKGFAEVLSRCEVRDDRIFEVLADVFDDAPGLGAMLFDDYGDPRALDLLHEEFAQKEVNEQAPLATIELKEYAAAIENLGGELTEEEREKLDAVERARQSFADQFKKAMSGPEDAEGHPAGEPFTLSDSERAEAKKKLARRRRRLRGSAKKKMKKAAKYGRYRVAQCLVNHNWREERLANVIQTRTRPDGNYVMAVLYVDLGCQGVKEAALHTNAPIELLDEIHSTPDIEFIDCDPHLAAKIAREGALLATHLGFSIPDEAFPAMTLLERFNPDKADEDVPLGSEQKPLFIPGPDDDVSAIRKHLAERVGWDGYIFAVHYE